MPDRIQSRHASHAVVLLAVAIGLGTAAGASPASARQEAGELPDVATLEQGFEDAFAAAVEMTDDGEPMNVMMAWGTVLMQAVILDRARSAAAGETASDSQALVEAVLERWQGLRPESGGPELLRALQSQDQTYKREAVLSLADRFPDDSLILFQALILLEHSGEVGRATDLAESFLVRNPDHPMAYSMLARAAGRNQTRMAEILQAWAEARPGDPDLVNRWMGSILVEQDPEGTRRVIGEFLSRDPTGEAALPACLRVVRGAEPAFVGPARNCVARIASDPDSSPELAERATSALAEMAAADGDWSALEAALEELDPKAALETLIAAARSLETPERCAERIGLLQSAAQAIADDGYRSVASALKNCADQPAAQTLYRSLLQRAPVDQVLQLVYAWVTKVNGVYRGRLPAGTADLIEQRLEEEPDSASLFRALDLVYRVADTDSGHLDLLRRWYESAPATLTGEAATDLAWRLVAIGDISTAVGVLESSLESRFEPERAELLWQLYLQETGEERAQRYAADLIAAEDRWRASTGHTLAARSAALGGDLASAERQYWLALAGEQPRKEVAVELLLTVALPAGDGALESLARQVCEQTRLAAQPSAVAGCAAELLTEAGVGEVAGSFFADQAAALPEDPDALRELASTAQAAGQVEVAERALRRILEIDPRNDDSWVKLGVFLEQQGRAEEVAVLLERSRDLFSPPPTFLSRAAGRALTAANQPERAIDLLLEARSDLPDHRGGEWSRSWIDHELQQAYERLGQRTPLPRPTTQPAPSPSFASRERPDERLESTTELRAAAHALLTGEGGVFDPFGAFALYSRAAEQGDPLAELQVAVMRASDLVPPDETMVIATELRESSVERVTAMAAEEEAEAQFLMGIARLLDLVPTADPALVRRWLEASAAQGESRAWHALAWMQETGRGLAAADPAAALDSYRRASELGNASSMNSVARLTLTPYGSGATCEEGLRWLERSARTGHARSAAFLGKVLFYGRGQCVDRAPRAGLEWLEAAAPTRQPGARFDLALALLLTGEDEAARARGLRLLEETAEEHDVLAVEVLAFLSATGIVVSRDAARAERLIAEAASLGSDGFPGLRRGMGSLVVRELLEDGVERLDALSDEGDPAAAGLLARLLTLGVGDGAGSGRATELALRAATAGDATGMRVLMGAYKGGAGVEPDLAEALEWQRRCAEAGDSFCMMFHGNALIAGDEVERDLEAGMSWLTRAAETGNWWAIADLGRLWDQGRDGLPRDPDEAAAWKQRLAELGDAESSGWLLYHGYR